MVTARAMATRLRQLYSLLIGEQLIESGSASAFHKVEADLSRQGSALGWRYRFTSSDPIVFRATATRKVERVQPRLQARLTMSEGDRGGLTGRFAELNTTLELYSDGDLLDRWHVDLANEAQAGPLFHLQHGGHSAGNSMRSREGKLGEPRWPHPPMDLILASELIVANFFPASWRKMQGNSTWSTLIRDAEAFCYHGYFQEMHRYLSGTAKQGSLLRQFWAS